MKRVGDYLIINECAINVNDIKGFVITFKKPDEKQKIIFFTKAPDDIDFDFDIPDGETITAEDVARELSNMEKN